MYTSVTLLNGKWSSLFDDDLHVHVYHADKRWQYWQEYAKTSGAHDRLHWLGKR